MKMTQKVMKKISLHLHLDPNLTFLFLVQVVITISVPRSLQPFKYPEQELFGNIHVVHSTTSHFKMALTYDKVLAEKELSN